MVEVQEAGRGQGVREGSAGCTVATGLRPVGPERGGREGERGGVWCFEAGGGNGSVVWMWGVG